LKKRLLGIIDAATYHGNLEDLIHHRSIAALPFAGRYRMIDFPLSNMANSGLRSVAIFPKKHYCSLMDHLGTGENWDLNRKRDGLFLYPAEAVENQPNQKDCFLRFADNIEYFYRSTQEYSLITNCYTVANMNYERILDFHMESGCDITEAIKHDGTPLDTFLVKTELLIHLIKTRDVTGLMCMRDVVDSIQGPYTISTYKYEGYAEIIDSIQTYFMANMKLLDPQNWEEVFIKNRPVYTKAKDEPPTRYMNGAKVQNSLISNGCLIQGRVENSIISRHVKIGKGSIIKNCIMLQRCEIGDNCLLESVISDKDARVKKGTVLSGIGSEPFVIRKGTIQGALMNS
jgi:glucose-1-phosphate adenylyltransferase